MEEEAPCGWVEELGFEVWEKEGKDRFDLEESVRIAIKRRPKKSSGGRVVNLTVELSIGKFG